MTDAQALKLVTKYMVKWRPRLGLSDFHINYYIDNSVEAVGDCYCQTNFKCATIRLQNPSIVKNVSDDCIYDGMTYDLTDLESTVLHELVHITFWPIAKNKVNDTLLEQAVNQMTYALLETDRKECPVKFVSTNKKAPSD